RRLAGLSGVEISVLLVNDTAFVRHEFPCAEITRETFGAAGRCFLMSLPDDLYGKATVRRIDELAIDTGLGCGCFGARCGVPVANRDELPSSDESRCKTFFERRRGGRRHAVVSSLLVSVRIGNDFCFVPRTS